MLTNKLNHVWIGGYLKGKSFQWIDESKFDYENYNLNIPDNYPPGHENCLEIWDFSNMGLGKWNDIPCERKYPSICKKPQPGN